MTSLSKYWNWETLTGNSGFNEAMSAYNHLFSNWKREYFNLLRNMQKFVVSVVSDQSKPVSQHCLTDSWQELETERMH